MADSEKIQARDPVRHGTTESAILNTMLTFAIQINLYFFDT